MEQLRATLHGARRDDTEVAACASRALHWAARVHGMTIRDSAVDATDGNVTLDGHVGSWPAKQAIVEAVEHVRGVRHVVDHLKIEPAALPRRDRPRPASGA